MDKAQKRELARIKRAVGKPQLVKGKDETWDDFDLRVDLWFSGVHMALYCWESRKQGWIKRLVEKANRRKWPEWLRECTWKEIAEKIAYYDNWVQVEMENMRQAIPEMERLLRDRRRRRGKNISIPDWGNIAMRMADVEDVAQDLGTAQSGFEDLR